MKVPFAYNKNKVTFTFCWLNERQYPLGWRNTFYICSCHKKMIHVKEEDSLFSLKLHVCSHWFKTESLSCFFCIFNNESKQCWWVDNELSWEKLITCTKKLVLFLVDDFHSNVSVRAVWYCCVQSVNHTSCSYNDSPAGVVVTSTSSIYILRNYSIHSLKVNCHVS